MIANGWRKWHDHPGPITGLPCFVHYFLWIKSTTAQERCAKTFQTLRLQIESVCTQAVLLSSQLNFIDPCCRGGFGVRETNRVKNPKLAHVQKYTGHHRTKNVSALLPVFLEASTPRRRSYLRDWRKIIWVVGSFLETLELWSFRSNETNWKQKWYKSSESCQNARRTIPTCGSKRDRHFRWDKNLHPRFCFKPLQLLIS